MVRESECFLDGLKRNCDGRSDGRSAQNQVNVGRDILYLNKLKRLMAISQTSINHKNLGLTSKMAAIS